MRMVATPARASDESLGSRVRRLRQRSGMTLKELGARCGLAFSTIAKIETNQISPTYESIIRLANGLSVEVTELFMSPSVATVAGRRTWTRAGEGPVHVTPQYEYQMLCADIARKQFIPLYTTIRAHSITDFSHLLRHEGEEFIFVVAGTIGLYTEHYSPLRLSVGDSCYFDSTMGHACVSTGDGDASVLWVCSSADVPPAISPVSSSQLQVAAVDGNPTSPERRRKRRALAQRPRTRKETAQ